MYQAIFGVLRFGRTLELITASFQLLTQLHQVIRLQNGSLVSILKLFCKFHCVAYDFVSSSSVAVSLGLFI